MSLATVAAPLTPALGELVDAVSARTGSWVVVERLGSVVAHGAGIAECPPELASSLLSKSTGALRAAVAWTRQRGGLRGELGGLPVLASDLGLGATAWFVGGPADEQSLPLLAAAVHGDDRPVVDTYVADLLHPRGVARAGRAPRAVLLAARADVPAALLGRRLSAAVAGTSARVHTEGDIVLVALTTTSEAHDLVSRVRVPGLHAGVAVVPEDASDWVGTARLAVGAAGAAQQLDLPVADPDVPLVAAELVVQEAQEAAADLARQLPQAPLRLLQEHDLRTSGELVASLTAWCRAGFDVPAAAAELHVHVNTLRYRIKRATEVSGLDVTQPRQLLALQLLLAV